LEVGLAQLNVQGPPVSEVDKLTAALAASKKTNLQFKAALAASEKTNSQSKAALAAAEKKVTELEAERTCE